ncbi:MAG: YggT family protein [Pyrinomonadaceae bacterium]
MQAISTISELVTMIVRALIGLIAVLMIVRLIMSYADLNPFSRIALAVRRVTDPLITPAKRVLANFGVDTRVAPLLTILIAILLGWFVLQLTASVLGAVIGTIGATADRNFVRVIGHLLYGLLDVYNILLFIRIIFSWGTVSSVNPVMRFLLSVTDPLLVPLRRMIPPVGMFDLSPIFAFILIWLFKAAIQGTLLS